MRTSEQLGEIFARARHVKLLALDVDGVLTDGCLYFSNNGEEMKTFSTLDGQGIKLLQNNGVAVALFTARDSALVKSRADNLGIQHVMQGCHNKLQHLDELLHTLGLDYGQTAYVGDDLPDLACIRRVALGVAVRDAHELIHEHAFCSTVLGGGHGAVREVCDWILKAQGHYDRAVAEYL